MTYIAKPKLHHKGLLPNKLGFTHRDYEGSISTLCAGCGHDSISAALIQACYELSIEPHRVAKLSGIGCSSKTPDYFLGNSHGFNSVHGRMPSVLTGANLANRDLIYLGVSGDGDSASIGLGQFAHCVRRGVNMVYICENNGVYGLTKGQFSATADKGSKSKAGGFNSDSPIDLVSLALVLGDRDIGAATRGYGDAPDGDISRRGERGQVAGALPEGLRCLRDGPGCPPERGEMIGKKGNDLVSIPIPSINLPQFRYGQKNSGGVGVGEGQPGQPLTQPQDGEGEPQAGDSPGGHILEVDLTMEEFVAYDLAAALNAGGVLPELCYKRAVEVFGLEATAELIYLVGLYCMVSVTLNGFDVPIPENIAS